MDPTPRRARRAPLGLALPLALALPLSLSLPLALAVPLAVGAGCCPRPAGSSTAGPAPAAAIPVVLAPDVTPEELARRYGRLAPATLDFDDSDLAPWERQVLARLVEASEIVNELFLLQVSEKNPGWREGVRAYDGPGREALVGLFEAMAGPWDRLDHDRPFLDVGPKPAGAGFYPVDLEKPELEAWLAAHPEDKAAFTSYFSVIRRQGDRLVAVPYSTAYRAHLERAAALLREAASIAQNKSLSLFLAARADAFLGDDYTKSDMAWMDLDSRIEATIGPYEVYEDGLFGYKAAFESFITVADAAASDELARLKGTLRDLERSLPIDDAYKTLDRGFESPIRVVDIVYTAGDTRAGVQTIAFNLPNDEKVQQAKGSKKVMLRNVMRAKFERILTPIVAATLVPELAAQVEFHAWFLNVLMHELAHGLGPGAIRLPSGEASTVNQALQDLYPPIEEAKADTTGLHNLTVLAAQGLYGQDVVRQAFVGHLGDIFRAVRFGVAEAHGRAVLLQFNYFWERGAITVDAASGRFGADLDKLIAANRDLAAELLTLQARGDRAAAAALLEKHGTMRPEMKAALDRLEAVPVDVRPVFPVLDRMQGWR